MLGGTFNPVHRGHIVIAEEVAQKLSLDVVLFVPAGQPWMKAGSDIAAATHRVEMLWLAVGGHPQFEISLLEVERQGPTYTVDTLEELRDRLGEGVEIYLIMGWGSLAELPGWREPDRLSALCRIVAVPRPGYSEPDIAALETKIPGISQRLILLDTPMVDISSTGIRERVAAGLSIEHLVPAGVADYIEGHRLYLERRKR